MLRVCQRFSPAFIAPACHVTYALRTFTICKPKHLRELVVRHIHFSRPVLSKHHDFMEEKGSAGTEVICIVALAFFLGFALVLTIQTFDCGCNFLNVSKRKVEKVQAWQKLPHHTTGKELQDLVERWNHKVNERHPLFICVSLSLVLARFLSPFLPHAHA